MKYEVDLLQERACVCFIHKASISSWASVGSSTHHPRLMAEVDLSHSQLTSCCSNWARGAACRWGIKASRVFTMWARGGPRVEVRGGALTRVGPLCRCFSARCPLPLSPCSVSCRLRTCNASGVRARADLFDLICLIVVTCWHFSQLFLTQPCEFSTMW